MQRRLFPSSLQCSRRLVISSIATQAYGYPSRAASMPDWGRSSFQDGVCTLDSCQIRTVPLRIASLRRPLCGTSASALTGQPQAAADSAKRNTELKVLICVPMRGTYVRHERRSPGLHVPRSSLSAWPRFGEGAYRGGGRLFCQGTTGRAEAGLRRSPGRGIPPQATRARRGTCVARAAAATTGHRTEWLRTACYVLRMQVGWSAPAAALASSQPAGTTRPRVRCQITASAHGPGGQWCGASHSQ
ncbi:hypothetical protein BDY21DRAFT_168505 [Lineolata rhizophorae]|uniref:Uncharacterized protein n=1 Tax=Lineolata rhizophorae TaxID=578093 RepID=A0A6A6PB11_9PEZI|nr:hypothetical protein BDY21DRAFT_168505 [Lineolata rhizophorae]